MERQTCNRWPARLLAVLVAVLVIGCGNQAEQRKAEKPDQFETLRAYVQTWLSEVDTNAVIMPSSYLKETILDDWDNQSEKYEIVSVRKPDDYANIGHIPKAINVYWPDIVTDESLARLDTNKALVFYCNFGHASMICGTILSLLGYSSCSLDFGMMDWNPEAMVKPSWDQQADYEVEEEVHESEESFLLPVLASDQTDIKDLIKEMARKYLGGEGTPVIAPSAVKAIVDDWENKETEYQIVDVRSKSNYAAGHVPHSINIPWASIAETQNLRRIDPGRTVIVYSENGQTGQTATTVLCLLGYHAVDMKLGMMDWNKSSVDIPKQWDGVADYPVEF